MVAFFRNRFVPGLCLLGLWLGFASVAPLPSANAGELFDYRIEYSKDGEVFSEMVELAAGQMVMIRVRIESRTGAIMDIMGDDDLDFSRIGGQIDFITFAGEETDGECFVIYDPDKEILRVRCPFCEIDKQRPAQMLFTVQIRDDAPPGTIDPQIVSVFDLGPGEEGEPRPCTTEAPEPIELIEGEKEMNPGLIVLSSMLLVEKEVSTDGSNYGPSVSVPTGSEVFFRLRVQNMGESAFFESSIEDLLPDGLANPVLVGSNPPSCSTGGGDLECADLGPLDPGADIEIVYKATVTATSGTIVNEARGAATPGELGNPGVELEETAEARVIVVGGPTVIPTLTEAGWIALIALFGAGIVFMRRRV